MINIKKKEKILILTIPLILISSLFLHSFVFSAPPSTPYNPGETLDPNCSPGDTNCTVYPPLPTYISTTTIVQLNNNLLSFNTGTLKILGILEVLGTTTFNGISYRWPTNPPLPNQFLQADGAGNLQWADVTFSTAGGWTDEGTIVRLQNITDSVAIGTTSAPEKLTVQGNILGIGNLIITGTGTFQSSPLTIGNLVLSHAGLTASRIFTFPDVSDTLVSLTATQTLTNKTLGAGSTWQGNVISTQYGGTGLSSIGSANQILGVNAGGTGLEYKNITSLLTAGTGISITGTTNATIANLGVLSLNSATGTLTLQGTPNQVNVNTSGNTITLSLPQDIATSSNVQFNRLRLSDSLEIVANPTSSKTSFLMEVTTYNFTTSTNEIQGIYVETKHGDFNYPLNTLVGITSNVVTYSQPVTDMVAFQAIGNNLAGSSNINNLIFYQSGPFIIRRNVSNYYNFLVKNPTYHSGTLSNLYGLYVEPLTVGTNRWAIYVAGDNPSYFAGQIQAKAGTLTSPSYSFIGETNTGIFKPSAGTIAFTTLGTERFRIDSSGNIGIGTTTPTAKLHVYGSTTLGASTSTPINFVGYVNSNIIPFSDNVYNLGASGFRWANIYAATTTVGDLVFANQFRFTESTSSPLALYLKNQIDENILEIDEYGNLKVKGGVYAQSFNVVSTKEEKKDINEITSSTEILENIRNMKFYSYRYLKDGGSSLHIGLIAEEAPKEILGENKKSIDLYKFVSYIGIGVKAIAEKLQNITSSTIDFVSNAVSYVKELIAEKIIAKRITVENLEVLNNVILNKIQMKDQYTGEIYCVWIENGEWKKVKGECDATSTINSQILESTSTQSTSTQENINSSSTTENNSTINNTSNNTNSSDNNSNLNQNSLSTDNLLQSTEQNNIQQNDKNPNQENSTNPQ